MEVLRGAVWVPPPITQGGEYEEPDSLKMEFDESEYETLKPIIAKMREIQKNENMSQEACITLTCSEWMKAERCGRLEGLDDIQEEENAPDQE